jgi:hypothetical protein
MAYQLDPFRDLLQQRPLPQASGPPDQDLLELRKKRLTAMGLEGTGLDRMNTRAIERTSGREQAQDALRQSAMRGVLGKAGAASL